MVARLDAQIPISIYRANRDQGALLRDVCIAERCFPNFLEIPLVDYFLNFVEINALCPKC